LPVKSLSAAQHLCNKDSCHNRPPAIYVIWQL
jgi:hypothetical protein